MQTILQNLRPLCLMLSIPLLNIFYALLNNADRGAYSLVTDLDHAIPFSKVFIVPYIIWYFFIFGTLVYFCFKDKKVYYRTLLALDLGLLVCYGIYFLFQTQVPRPELVGHDVLTKLVALIYSNDQPYNAFPSIHVLLSFLMIKGINKYQGKNYLNISLVYLNAVLIILSTLFVKQHVILDVLGAIVLGSVMFDLVFYANMEELRARLKKPYLLLMLKRNQKSEIRLQQGKGVK
ncbi:phosphatase PAP2 family protein [Desulfitobacterium sp. PCE1]|uniref:phosphatase PAP2 family protein n=1 Tax=Desulfitobacterium sp. PCE1 TaxID=146907 RepID=UPI0003819C74|nr:phosphatase PAP2 family protein [Desulfitobacterium sp. PCE1]